MGATAERYAVEVFERYVADAVTVNPYLGPESLRPFLRRADRGVVILCRTSNPESGWLQDYPSDDPLYLRVARAACEWNTAGNVMLVVGATYPEPLRRVREVVGSMSLLVPGVGSQGGDVAAVVEAGTNRQRAGLVINASRSVTVRIDRHRLRRSRSRRGNAIARRDQPIQESRVSSNFTGRNNPHTNEAPVVSGHLQLQLASGTAITPAYTLPTFRETTPGSIDRPLPRMRSNAGSRIVTFRLSAERARTKKYSCDAQFATVGD